MITVPIGRNTLKPPKVAPENNHIVTCEANCNNPLHRWSAHLSNTSSILFHDEVKKYGYDCITPSAFTIPKRVTITLGVDELENEKKDAIEKAIDLYKANALEEVEKAIEEKEHPHMVYDKWGPHAYNELENLKAIKKYLLYGIDMKPSKEKEIELKLEKLRQYEKRESEGWCPKCTPLYPRGSLIAIMENTGGLWHSDEQCSVVKATQHKKWYEFWK